MNNTVDFFWIPQCKVVIELTYEVSCWWHIFSGIRIPNY